MLTKGLAALLAGVAGVTVAVFVLLGRDAWVAVDRLTRVQGPLAQTMRTGISAPALAARLPSVNQARFEGGNIGAVIRTGLYSYELRLRSDNDDALPEYWRQWFYLKLEDVPTDAPVSLVIKGAGQWHYYVPFFSYDDATWKPFRDTDITQPTRLSLRVRTRFRHSTVWLSRFEPYDSHRLRGWLDGIKSSPYVTLGSLGRSTQGRDIPTLTIADPSAEGPKTRVVLHARTHPGEVGGSYLLEGFVRLALGSGPVARSMREKFVIDIVPMLNVDGVVAGNYRVTPGGLNLEGKWYVNPADPRLLDPARAPLEVRLFHAWILRRMEDGVPVTVALNLHSSGGEPEDRLFAFPHFGPVSLGYNATEARLYRRQVAFLKHFAAISGRAWLNPTPKEGHRGFVARSLVETWWWRNFRAQVMALTVEATYGLAGPTGRWVVADDLRWLGWNMARAVARYHGLDGAVGDAPRLPQQPASAVAAH